MGKIKNRQYRLHQSNSNSSNPSILSNANELSSSSLPLISASSDIFAGINIDLGNIKKLDSDIDVKSLSGRSHRDIKKEEQHLPKKEKMRRRRERFIQKLDLIQRVKKKMIEKKKRQKTVVVGDMMPLLEALPEIEADKNQNKTKTKGRKLKERTNLGARIRQREHLKDMKHFHRVLNDKIFKADPVKTIREYLKEKVQSEREAKNTI